MNTYQIFISTIFVLSCYCYLYVTGSALLTLFNFKSTKSLNFIAGFCLFFAVGELIALPFMLNRLKFYLFFLIFSIYILVSFIVSLIYLIQIKRDINTFKFKFSFLNKKINTFSLIIIIVLTSAIVCFCRFDGDDAFYLAIQSSIRTTGQIFKNNVSIGLDKYAFPKNYQFCAYEVILTIFTYYLGFNQTVICHTILPMILIPSFFIANYALSEVFFQDFNKRSWYFLLFCLTSLFIGFSNYQIASFMLVRTWMGKCSTASICLIFLTIIFLRNESVLTNEKVNLRSTSFIILTIIALLSGAGTSAMGLYLLPVAFFIYSLSFINILISKEIGLKGFITFIFNVSIAALPSAILLISFYLFVKQGNTITVYNNFTVEKTWSDNLFNMFGSNIAFMLLSIAASIYFLFFGNSKEKLFFFYSPFLLMITFLNPLFFGFVGKYLTSFPVYWRFYWLIPFQQVVCAFIVRIFYEFKALNLNKLKWITLIPVVLLLNPAYFVLNQNLYYSVENSAKIPNKISTSIQEIEKNVNTDDPNKLYLLSLPSYNIYMRQYSGEIAMVMPRLNYVEEALELKGEEKKFEEIKNLFVYDKNEYIDGFVESFDINVLKDLDITLIISPDKRDELSKDYSEIKLENGDLLYIRNDIKKADQKS